MTVAPEDEFAAAEFALGTLSPGERAALAARRLREPELDEAIRAWEERLAPLAEAAPPIEPPGDRSRRDPGAHSGGVFACDRRRLQMLQSWRCGGAWRAGGSGAIAASALAAVLAIGLVARETTRRGRATRICRDPAEGRGLAGDRGDGRSRQAGTAGASGRCDRRRPARRTNCGSSTRSSARRARSA